MQTTNVDRSVDHPTCIKIGLKKTEFEFEIQKCNLLAETRQNVNICIKINQTLLSD